MSYYYYYYYYDTGLVLWIPYHMIYVLKKIIADGGVNSRSAGHLQTLVTCLNTFNEEQNEPGEGWESLFVLVLLVRCLTRSLDTVLTINFASFTYEDYKVTVNEPLEPQELSIENMKNVKELLTTIPDEVDRGRHHIAIYWPIHSGSQVYDIVAVAWKDGKKFAVVCYQLKEGDGLKPAKVIDSCNKIFLINGEATQEENEATGGNNAQNKWTTPSKEEISECFGSSGHYWTRQNWNELNANE